MKRLRGVFCFCCFFLIQGCSLEVLEAGALGMGAAHECRAVATPGCYSARQDLYDYQRKREEQKIYSRPVEQYKDSRYELCMEQFNSHEFCIARQY